MHVTGQKTVTGIEAEKNGAKIRSNFNKDLWERFTSSRAQAIRRALAAPLQYCEIQFEAGNAKSYSILYKVGFFSASDYFPLVGPWARPQIPVIEMLGFFFVSSYYFWV